MPITEAYILNGAGVCEVLREGILAALLGTAAWIDLKSRKIPNYIPAAGFLARLLLWAAEVYLYGPGKAAAAFLRELGGSFAVLLLLMLAVRIRGRGLGMGDVKLAGSTALFAGFRGTLGILLWGLLAAAAAGVCMELAPDRKRKPEIPLAPFFLAGFLLERILAKSFSASVKFL